MVNSAATWVSSPTRLATTPCIQSIKHTHTHTFTLDSSHLIHVQYLCTVPVACLILAQAVLHPIIRELKDELQYLVTMYHHYSMAFFATSGFNPLRKPPYHALPPCAQISVPTEKVVLEVGPPSGFVLICISSRYILASRELYLVCHDSINTLHLPPPPHISFRQGEPYILSLLTTSLQS